MKKAFLSILLILCITQLHAQREAANWYFGYGAGLDFNSGSPVALTNGNLFTMEGCATISDLHGNLLFYTDGTNVWNAKHSIMPNGTGLLGHTSSTQSAIIVPNPSNPSIYYIFTVDMPNAKNADSNPFNNEGDGVNDGLCYSEVNMNLDGGFGDINPLKKNIHLVTYNKNDPEEVAFKCSEKITAVQRADTNFYWVITQFTDKFYAFKVSNNGVDQNPITSTTPTGVPIGGYGDNGIGYLKSSPNGKKLAIVHSFSKFSNWLNTHGNLTFNTGHNTGKVLLYNFDNATGKVSNELLLLNNTTPYGVEFSSKTHKLYVTTNNFNSNDSFESSSMYQYNLLSQNIPTSRILIVKNSNTAGALQLAIDDKIYRAGYKSSSSNFLSVINKPEADGTNCDFSYNSIYLEGKKSELGLPPFIQSLFLFNFKYEFTCFGDATHFFISTLEPVDSVIWDFGDGTTSTDLDAYHTFNTPGTYSVTLTKFVDGDASDPLTKDVVIREKPQISNSIVELVQCDSFDDNPNDQLATFNLENSIDGLTLNNSDKYDVLFYLNDSDANNSQNPLPTAYTSITPNQLITAKIRFKDSDCYSLGKVKLTAVSSSLILPNDMIGCDNGDGTATFDLNAKQNEIIANFALPSDVTFKFYETKEDALNAVNELDLQYTSADKKIFFIAEQNGICYGNGEFNLKVNFFPTIELNDTLNICESNFPTIINATIPADIKDNYEYLWSNGSHSFTTTITDAQPISVIIKDKAVGCEKTKTFTINKVLPPIISSIDIKDNSTIIVNSVNNFNNLYTLDNINNTYQTENIFYNITPGTHTIYVKDDNLCSITEQSVFVLGFPKYFTPNGDGINDIWEIKGLDFSNFTYSNITIFDRFGKNLGSISPTSSWDGRYKNILLPSDDYWFSVTVTDKNNISKTYTGHFSLVRF